MSPTLPPIPSSGSMPPPDTQGPPLVSMPEEPSQGNPAMEQARAIMSQLMGQRRANESMASQYPPAAADLRAANEALKSAMLTIVREVQQTPGMNPAPPVGAG